MEPDDLPLLLSAAAARLRLSAEMLLSAAAGQFPAPLREHDRSADKHAAAIDRTFFRLLRLANDLSMTARLSSPAPLPLRDADIVDLVGDICDRAGGLFSLAGLRLRFLCAPEHRVCAFAPESTEFLLWHLLSNAMKATSTGGTVTVELRFAGGQIFLSVTDTGCGIPAEQLAALFACHPQEDFPPAAGLGLPLCRRIARRQCGVLMAESRCGEGSRFTLSLPERLCGTTDTSVRFDAFGGFNPTLAALADALPADAFLLRSQG